MSERLYYTDPFLLEFDAIVQEARILADGRAAVLLDRTAFYPTSGGQIFDRGVLAANGREVPVIEVSEDTEGEVLHHLEMALAAGSPVHGRVDAERRFDHMQQHTGQHVLSAAFLRLHDIPTVSFHMGNESCTIDLAISALSQEQIIEAERLSNQVVAEDRLVEIHFLTPEEALSRGVRKLPDRSGDKLRIIDVRDFDFTACGGTHVGRTGQIGAILLRKTEKVQQGTRVEFVCGQRAVRTARRDYSTLVETAALHSTHIWELPQQVSKALDEAKAADRERRRLLEELAEAHAERLLREAPQAVAPSRVSFYFADRDAAFVRLLAQKLLAAGRPLIALLACPDPKPTLVFAQTGTGLDAGTLVKEIAGACGGRGGGSRELGQGGVPTPKDAQEALTAAKGRLG